MQLLYSRNPWSLRYGPDPTINFCFWALLLDGLRVPPFDQHLDGDGALRDLGLTQASWQAWLLRVIDPQQRKQDEEQLRQQGLAAYLKISGEPDLEHLGRRYQAEQLKISIDPPLPSFPEFHFYHASWGGSTAIRNRLIELQEPYKKHVYRQYDVLCSDLIRAVEKEERRSGTNLYDELQPYHTRIPPLAIHFVEYDHPLDYLIPPATLIMTVQDGQPNPQEFHERVLAAATELAARPGRRGRHSLYRRMREPVGQFSTTYRRHERQPAPPQPAKQEIPRLTDPARQALLEELSDRSFYGIVDLATLQFLREKQRPGWKLYEVTFQEIDREQHRMTFLLRQHEDGSWCLDSGGSSIDMQNEWSKISLPVRDHPLIFLLPQGVILDNQLCLLTAYGDVIDNGFHVKQVRLVNDAGQILEDTVEDGYVLFACTLELRVQLPMQAELYDHQGRLVWQQTVTIDGGLPSWQKGKRKE